MQHLAVAAVRSIVHSLRELAAGRPGSRRSIRRRRTVHSSWEALEPRALLAISAASAELPFSADFGIVHHYDSNSSLAERTVAADANGNFVVTWEKLNPHPVGNIYARVFSADGTPITEEFQVNTSTDGDMAQPSVAMAPNGDFVITWTKGTGDDLGSAILGQRFSAGGVPAGSEFRVDTTMRARAETPQTAPAGQSQVAMDASGGFVVTWTADGTLVADLTYTDVYIRRFEATGAPLTGSLLVNNEGLWGQHSPSLAMSPSGSFLVTWASVGTYNDVGDRDGSAILARRFDAGSNALGLEFIVNSTTTGSQDHAASAMDANGNSVVVFQCQTAEGFRIKGQRYHSNGTPLGDEFLISTDFNGANPAGAYYPSVSMDANGAFLVAWGVINQQWGNWRTMAQLFDANGVMDGNNFRVDEGSGNARSVASLGNGRWIATWTHEGYFFTDIRGQLYGPRVPPVLNSPGATTTNPAAEFQWSPVYGAKDYELWIHNESTGAAPVRPIVSTTTFQPPQAMGIGRYRVWLRTRMYDNAWSAWSPLYRLAISTPPTFTSANSQQATPRPSLTWSAIPGATRYDLWIDNRSTSQSQVVRLTDLTTPNWTSATDMPLGQYRAWVRAIDAAGNPAQWSLAHNFSVVTPPTLTAPLNATFSQQPTFTWNMVPGATQYDVFVRNLATGVTVLYPKGIAGTSWTATSALAIGRYRWWVQARSAQNVLSLWSLPVDIQIGGKTSVLSPVGSTSDATPEFTWRPVEGAVRYELWVASTSVRVVYETQLTGTSFAPATNLPAGSFRIWVRAVSAPGIFAPWSDDVRFSIV